MENINASLAYEDNNNNASLNSIKISLPPDSHYEDKDEDHFSTQDTGLNFFDQKLTQASDLNANIISGDLTVKAKFPHPYNNQLYSNLVRKCPGSMAACNSRLAGI